MRRRTLLLLLLLLAAALISVPVDAAGPVSLVRGEAGDHLLLDAAFGSSWQDVNIGRLVLRTPGRQARLDVGEAAGLSAKSRALDFGRAAGAGCAMIVADLGPGFEKGRPDSWQRITHATKIVTCSSDAAAALSGAEIEARRAAGSLLMAKTGSRVELQPLANPATLRPGADLPLRAFCDGTARAGIEVAATAPDGSRHYAATDRVGAAVLSIDAAGRWRFEVTCTAGAGEADAPQLVAELIVDVLPAAAWSMDEAGP